MFGIAWPMPIFRALATERVRAGRDRLARLSMFVVAMSTAAGALAQDPQPAPFQQLDQGEIRAKYQNCPDGYYTGPRPGKGVYTKDHFLWVVTPEFAQRYCMPPEFVSNELKGAEAVAFTISENRDEERCGFNGVEEKCGFAKSLRFELYFKSGTPLPMKVDTTLALVPRAPSAFMIAMSEKEYQSIRRNRIVRAAPPVAFEGSQIGISGIKGGKIVWPITTLYEQTYFARVFEGIDYLAVEGSTGRFTNPRMEVQDIRKFVITVRKLGDRTPSNDGRQLSDFAYLVELPESFSDKIRAIDKARGLNYKAMAEEFLRRQSQNNQ
jgi:hypothetical protein